MSDEETQLHSGLVSNQIQILDIKQFLKPNNVVSYCEFDQSCFNKYEKILYSNVFKLLHGYNQNQDENFDESFNRIVDELLTAEKLIEIINNNQRLTPYVVDSLKRYHTLNDVHTILSKCVDLQEEILDKEIAKLFEDLIDTITTRILLTTTIESTSNESQRFLANFIKKNDLPIPFTYYVWNRNSNNLSYKINFNCLMEPLCLTNDRLLLQFGSKKCTGLGKTSLLPFIFNEKRKESLFTDGNKKYRASCIDVLFGNTKNNSYTIFDIHGTIDERNLSLVQAIQVYTTLQIVYVTEDDLPNSSNTSNDDFLSTIMNYSSYSPNIPTNVVIFDPNFDKEDKTQQLINRFQNYYSEKQWPNMYWSSSPVLATMNNLTKIKRTRYIDRLKNQFSQLFEDVEPKMNSENIFFRSCFSIQELYLDLKGQNSNEVQRKLQRKFVKFDIENKLEQLFESITDETENLKIMTPTSYYRSEIDILRKKKLLIMMNDTATIEELDKHLKQLELDEESQSGFTKYSLFIMDLLNNQTYIDVLITDLYLEKWRSLYTPRIKQEKEEIKLQKSLVTKRLTEQEELIEKETKLPSTSNNVVDQKSLDNLKKLREENEQLNIQLSRIDQKLSNIDLTIGLLCDELFALYDHLHDKQPVKLDQHKNDFIEVARNIAKLVYKGFALHILRSRPLLCQSRLMKMAVESLHVYENSSLLILTVIGEQSSAKSSLLNSTFGCNFRVSAGRCTIGMYLGIVYHKNLTIIILDTEGLMSLEESGSIFDNQMTTMAVLTAHLVLINHKGELSSTLEGLIGMSLYAKLQIQSMPFKPKLLFILRDQTTRNTNTNTFYEQLSRFKDNLQKSSNFLKVSIDDELEIKQENIVLLPSAFSEDINEDLNLTQRWRNQTFAYEINQLRKRIFDDFHTHCIEEKFGFKNIDALYSKLSSNWKTIDELDHGLLACKSLAELNLRNELKSTVKEIIQKNSIILLKDGTELLNNLLQKEKERTEESLDNNTNNSHSNSNIDMKKFVEKGFQELDDLTYRLIQDATNEFEQLTQQSYYAVLKPAIQKNIEPSLRCIQQLLKQQFDQQAYTISKEKAALQVQKDLLKSAKIYFDKQTRTETDVNELNAALEAKYNVLHEEFETSLNLLRKSQDDITETVLTIYNQLVKTRGATANTHDIYNLCRIFDPKTYHEECRVLDQLFTSIQPYLIERQQSNWVKKLADDYFLSNPWKEFREQLHWFNDNHNDSNNRKIFLNIAENVIPQLNQDINTMLSTIKLSYNDPQLIINLIQYVDNSMKSQTSPIEQNWKYLNIPKITKDLLLIAFRFLIEQAKQITDRHHAELNTKLNELNQWKQNIKQQFLLIQDSFEQAQKFKNDLGEQIVSEIIRIHTNIIINNIHTKITNNSEIDPDKIATNAYDDSIGSNPPIVNNIMKYILDINRYYLEIALNKIKISQETIVTNQIHLLENIVFNCVDKAIETVKQHNCHNIQQVYQDVVKNMKKILPDFQLSPMIGISAEIKDSDRFKKSFEQLYSNRQQMYDDITRDKHLFETAAIGSCIDLIKTRLGCQARCPFCGMKCDNTDVNHTKHYSSRHLAAAFIGVCDRFTGRPSLYLCNQIWLTHHVYTGEEKFNSLKEYFLKRNPEWHDDLESKSTAGNSPNGSLPPSEQRRAWMAVRNALIKRYLLWGMIDFERYDPKFYPDIKSVDADFTVTWDYNVSDKDNSNSSN